MKVIKIDDDAYWALKDKKLEMEKYLNGRVTYSDVIKHLFTRELISLRQGE